MANRELGLLVLTDEHAAKLQPLTDEQDEWLKRRWEPCEAGFPTLTTEDGFSFRLSPHNFGTYTAWDGTVTDTRTGKIRKIWRYENCRCPWEAKLRLLTSKMELIALRNGHSIAD